MSHALIDTVAAFIERHSLLEEGATVLVGVSGGVDSMTCLSVLRGLGYDVYALHANYGLRDGAGADEALVRRWCEEQSPPVPFFVVSLDAEARANEKDESLQEAARQLRYTALAERSRKIGASAVAVGHHRDDQAETMLLNLARGAGPEGLAGMRPSRPLQFAPDIPLVRPLLDVSREDIKQYAEAVGLLWRTDPTNRSLDYDRGVIRTEILPRLADHFGDVRGTLARSAGLMGEYVDQALRPALQARMEQAYVECEDGGWMALDHLRAEPPVWRRRLLLEGVHRALPSPPHSYAMAEELDALIQAQVGRRVEVGGGVIWREREGIRFLPNDAEPESISSTPVPWNERVETPQGIVEVKQLFERPDSLDSGTPFEAFADADRLGEELEVRSWQEGDRIQPLGLEGTKRVSALLTDAKVPAHRRAKVSVLCTDRHIAWVIGHRLDHRVRVRPETERVARLVLRPREKASDSFQSS